MNRALVWLALFGVACAAAPGIGMADPPTSEAAASEAPASRAGLTESAKPAPGRVIGIGGVFFKVDDSAAANEWYRAHLGIDATAQGYTFFPWRDHIDPVREGRTVWTTFPRDSDYFGDTGQQFMVNYIVDDLDALLARLATQGVQRVGAVESFDYGRFAWILDADGNRVELWEPAQPPG
jgi:catechol 2,3-dioxygenase-like lactoylglutathione lyase family enzyme